MGDFDGRKVTCGTHGSVGAAFVCGHIVDSDAAPVGFNEPELEPDDPEPQAWCDACDELVERVGEWNDETEAFADIRLVCEFCFARFRELHDHAAGDALESRPLRGPA